MITVPACGVCQTEKGYGDDDLAHYVAFSWAGSQHPRAREQLQRAAKATKEGFSKIGRAFSEGGSIQEVFSDSGIYLFDAWAVPLPDQNRDMFKTLEYIIRGLHVVRNFRWDRKIPCLPTDLAIEVRGIDRLKAYQVIGDFLQIPHEPFVIMKNQPIEAEPPIAMWSRTVPVGGDSFSRIWLLIFNDQESFIGVTGNVALAALEIGAAMQALTPMPFMHAPHRAQNLLVALSNQQQPKGHDFGQN